MSKLSQHWFWCLVACSAPRITNWISADLVSVRSLGTNFSEMFWNAFENVISKMAARSPRLQCNNKAIQTLILIYRDDRNRWPYWWAFDRAMHTMGVCKCLHMSQDKEEQHNPIMLCETRRVKLDLKVKLYNYSFTWYKIYKHCIMFGEFLRIMFAYLVIIRRDNEKQIVYNLRMLQKQRVGFADWMSKTQYCRQGEYL